MENLNKEEQPAKPIEKTAEEQAKVEKAVKENRQLTDTDNDNGFVSPATEESSNKGQGPAGEDL